MELFEPLFDQIELPSALLISQAGDLRPIGQPDLAVQQTHRLPESLLIDPIFPFLLQPGLEIPRGAADDMPVLPAHLDPIAFLQELSTIPKPLQRFIRLENHGGVEITAAAASGPIGRITQSLSSSRGHMLPAAIGGDILGRLRLAIRNGSADLRMSDGIVPFWLLAFAAVGARVEGKDQHGKKGGQQG